jgi:hypothetical protein
MKKRNLIMAALAIIAMGLAIPLGAQTIPSVAQTSPASNQRSSTATVFTTDVDNYMNVNRYGNVKFDKLFALVDYTSRLDLGYATKFGDIYLGTYYNGTGLTRGTDETTRLTTNWDTTLQQMTSRVDEKVYARTTTVTNNNIAALIGVMGMGIKVGFYEGVTTYNTPYNVSRGGTSTGTSTVTTNQDGSIAYTGNDSLKYYESTGSMVPYIQWGMKLDLGSGLVLLPRVGTNFTFYDEQLVDEYYSNRTVYDGKIQGQERIDRRGKNNSYNNLNVSAGADLDLDANMRLILDYNLNTRFYDSSFGDAGRAGSVKGTISWDNTGNYSVTNKYVDRTEKDDSVQIQVSEQSYTYHSINPGFRWQDSAFGEDLKFGVRIQLPITIGNESSIAYTDRWRTQNTTYNDEINSQNNETTVTNTHTANAGNKTEISYFSINPTVGVGASYGLIPNKFTVNAGVYISLPGFTSTNTTTSRDGISSTYTRTEKGSDGNKYVSSETTTVTAPPQIVDSVRSVTSWTALSGVLRGGFVFSFSDNFAMDMSAGVGTFTYNLTSLTALFTVKF